MRACPLHFVLRVGLNLPSLLLGGIQPPFPPIRRDIGRLHSNPLAASLCSAPKAVPPLPLLTLEGCPKDGVVSPLLTLEGCPKDGVVSPLLTLRGVRRTGWFRRPPHPSRSTQSNTSIPACHSRL